MCYGPYFEKITFRGKVPTMQQKPTTHERFMDAINEERFRLRSRRSVLATAAKMTAGGALGLAFAGSAISPFAAKANAALAIALAQAFTDDTDILNYALTLEHLEYAFYRDGLAKLGESTIAKAGDAETFTLLSAIRDHEKVHVDALTKAVSGLKGVPVQEATYDFGYSDAAGFLEVAMALENTGVAAYAGAAPAIMNKDLLAAALGIHSVEARHAALLNRLNKMTPFPDAIDQPQTREEVLKVAGGFIKKGKAPASPAASGSGTGTQPGTPPVAVSIKQFAFTPNSVTIPVGGTVMWTNNEIIPHTVTADDGSFTSDTLNKGDTFSHTFTAAGTVAYHCTYHTNMKADVIVQ